MEVTVRVYHRPNGYTLVITGGERHGREYRIDLSLSESDELANALLSQLIARVPIDLHDSDQPKTKRRATP